MVYFQSDNSYQIYDKQAYINIFYIKIYMPDIFTKLKKKSIINELKVLIMFS